MKNNFDFQPAVNSQSVDLTLWKRIPKLPLILCLLLSAIMVTGAILTKSFWGDEVWSIKVASLSGQNFINALAEDYHPPFYFILLKFWIFVFNDGEISSRVFQFVIGGLFISSFYILFRKIHPQKIFHPLFLLFLLSGELWLFLPMLRYYVLAAALVLIATYIFFNWISAKRKKDFYLLLVLYILLLYTDYPSSVIIPIHFIFLLFKKKELIFKHIVLMIISAAAFLPWLVILYLQLGKLLNRGQYADLNSSPFSVILKFIYSIYAFLFSETVFPFEIIFMAGITALIIVCIAGINFKGLFNKNIYLFYSIVTIIIGVLFTSLLTTFISKHTSFIYTPSRTFFVLPFIFILLSFIYENLKNKSWKRIFVIVFLTLSVYSISNLLLNRHFLMPVYASPWKEVLNGIKGENNIIVTDEGDVYNYYADHLTGIFPKSISPASKSDFINILRQENSKTMYLLVLGRESTEPTIDKDIISYITTNFTLLDERKYLPIAESYQEIKSRILKRPSYEAKFTLMKYKINKNEF